MACNDAIGINMFYWGSYERQLPYFYNITPFWCDWCKEIGGKRAREYFKKYESKMKAEHYFIELTKVIENLASKADLIIYDGAIKKRDWEELVEDCIIASCFYTGVYHERPPFLIDFIENGNLKEKLSKQEKKQSGAFFTPVYISDYIVEKTINPLVDKILNNKRILGSTKVERICKLTICDPAMGGGVFLVSAHNYLMKKLIEVDQDKFSISDLSTMSSKTLFGVDINPKAVKFSKMILNLNIAKWKILEKIDEYVIFVEKNIP